MTEPSSDPTIKVLREQTVKRIAAGEIIDRPHSLCRELLDNALDAGSTAISLELESGGLSRVRVVDNGLGMNEADLRLCVLPHATSKISTDADLFSLRTLGFRGEALSSIGACARLEITSRTADSEYARCLVVEGGRASAPEPCRGNPGTVMDVTGLFARMPARRQFLKSPSAESAMCRSVFLDKALPFPGVRFHLQVDGRTRDTMPEQDLASRIRTAYGSLIRTARLERLEAAGEGYAVTVIAAGPEIGRKDRRLLQVFVNGRRIHHYPLHHAVEYAYSPALPGGVFPCCFLFVEIDPALVDFNVHPTKREARIRNLAELHRGVTRRLSEFLTSFRITVPEPNQASAGPPTESDLIFPLRPTPGSDRASTAVAPSSAAGPRDYRYLGQIFGLFLVVERDDGLLLIDQHAAHERLIYEELRSRPPVRQDLLMPISFDVSRAERDRLVQNEPALRSLGLVLEWIGGDTVEVAAASEALSRVPEGELVELLKGLDGGVERLRHELLSRAACRSAVMDGQELDPDTAHRIIRGALQLHDARCPHGRPVWYALERNQLFRLVGRT